MHYRTSDAIHEVRWYIVKDTRCSWDSATRTVEPLVWWVSTGRCTGTDEITLWNMTKRELHTLARKCYMSDKEFAANDYDAVIKRCRQYIRQVTKRNSKT